MSDKRRRQIQGLASPKGQWTSCCLAGPHVPLISNPIMEQEGASLGPDVNPVTLGIVGPLVSMAPSQVLSPLMATCLFLNSAVTLPV